MNQKLKHTRKDGLKDFAWGTVNMCIGKTDYSADVVIGNNGTRLYLYDVINLKEITIKDRRSNQQRYSQKEKMLNIVTSSDNSISQDLENDNNDLRFSMRQSVGDTKNLIAVHNISDKKLMEMVKLGGFPMPRLNNTPFLTGCSR